MVSSTHAAGRVLTVLGVLLAVAVLVVVVLWVFQRHLVYQPYGQPGSPAQEGLANAEEVTVRTADGLDLTAWHVPAEAPRAAVLVVPGNAGHRGLRAPLAAALRDLGLAVLLLEYRGFGGNPGTPGEEGLVADARAGWDHLAERHPDLPIVLYGESIGGGVAVGAASAHDRDPAAVILRSPFPSLAAVGQRAFPWLPVRALLRDRYPVAEQLADLEVPLLVLAGSDDELVPPELSAEVAEGAPGPVRTAVLDAEGHNDPALLAGEALLAEVAAFLDDVLEG